MVRITEDTILCPTDAITRKELRELEKYVNIVDGPLEVIRNGAFNGVRVKNYFMCKDPEIPVLGESHVNKTLVKKTFELHEKVHQVSGLEPKFFNLTEFVKSGADLGCMIMHLNYYDYFD